MQLEEMIAEREQEGRKEERLAIARKMLQDNVDKSIVAKYTGLTVDELSEMSQTE